VDRWCASREVPRGAIVPAGRGWALAKLWDIDRLRPDWRRKTAQEMEDIFTRVGLRGPFWSVRA
jgi:hypothetical protein